MIAKLIKYDLRLIYRQLGIVYLVTLGCALVARLTDANGPFWFEALHEFSQSIAVGLAIGVFITMFLRLCIRLRQSFYGDESYLTHTLPVSRRTLWTAKLLMSAIVIASTMFVTLATLGLLFLSSDTLAEIRYFEELAAFDFWTLAPCVVLLVFLEFVFTVQAGFTGVLLGHRFRKHRALYSSIFGVAAYLIGCVLILLACFVWSSGDQTFADIFFRGDIDHLSNFVRPLCVISVFYTLLIAAAYTVDYHILSRGVNVD